MQSIIEKHAKQDACCFPGFASTGVRGAPPHRPAIKARQDCRAVHGLEHLVTTYQTAFGGLRGGKPLPS